MLVKTWNYDSLTGECQWPCPHRSRQNQSRKSACPVQTVLGARAPVFDLGCAVLRCGMGQHTRTSSRCTR
eukprot:944135-Rhodomonas_salina.1